MHCVQDRFDSRPQLVQRGAGVPGGGGVGRGRGGNGGGNDGSCRGSCNRGGGSNEVVLGNGPVRGNGGNCRCRGRGVGGGIGLDSCDILFAAVSY